MLITFEGINGVGKTTFIQDLLKVNDNKLEMVQITSKPDPNLLKTCKIFNDPNSVISVEEQIEYTKLFLDKQIELSEEMKKDNGKIYLADRWTLSSYVYTVFPKYVAKDEESMEKYQAFFTEYSKNIISPDILMLFYVSNVASFVDLANKDRNKPISGYENLENMQVLNELYRKVTITVAAYPYININPNTLLYNPQPEVYFTDETLYKSFLERFYNLIETKLKRNE